MAEVHQLMTDFGAVTLPDDMPTLRYPQRSSVVRAYLRFLHQAATAAYLAGRPPVAPSFSAWRQE